MRKLQESPLIGPGVSALAWNMWRAQVQNCEALKLELDSCNPEVKSMLLSKVCSFGWDPDLKTSLGRFLGRQPSLCLAAEFPGTDSSCWALAKLRFEALNPIGPLKR